MVFLESQSAHEGERPSQLIRGAQVESEHQVSRPLARMTTCGHLGIEVLHTAHVGENDHLELVYGPPDATLLAKKGTSTAFLLLALLASQPGCFATKDWLSEKLGHSRSGENDGEDEEEYEGLKRVDNVVSHLRHLLYPSRPNEASEDKLVRRRLVAYQRASGESGPGYRLAGSPLLWLDVEAISEHVKRARRLEQFGADGLAEWRAAYDLAMQGSFLPQEIYSDWAQWRRQEVEAHLWGSVQALWHRYVGQGEAGETEALCVLRDYWLKHPSKEDALRPLLELLGKREHFGQAEEYYEQLCTILDAEGRQPDRRTREVMDFLRALQIQRSRKKPMPALQDVLLPFLSTESISPSHLTPITKDLDEETPYTLLLVGACRSPRNASIDMSLYKRNIRIALHFHKTNTAQELLQDVCADIQALERLEQQARGRDLYSVGELLISNNLVATKIVKDQQQYALAYMYANNAVRVAKRLEDGELVATTKYTRGCVKLEWALFGSVKQGMLQLDREKIWDAIRDFQNVLAMVHTQRLTLHPQLYGFTLLQLGRAYSIFDDARSSSTEVSPFVFIDQAEDFVDCDPIEDVYSRLILTGTVSGLHRGAYLLNKAEVSIALGKQDQAIAALEQLKQLTERTYGQEETRNQVWRRLVMAKALMEQGAYPQVTPILRETMLVCRSIKSAQNAVTLLNLYRRLAASPYGMTADVREIGVMLKNGEKLM